MVGGNVSPRKKKVQQLAKEDLGDNLKCARHETALTYGPLRKRAPENLLEALGMYSELPLGPSEFFRIPRTKATFFSVCLSLLDIKASFLPRFVFANNSHVQRPLVKVWT